VLDAVMNEYGILFGLFIIGCGFYAFFQAMDEDENGMVTWRYGVLVDARSVKLFGKIVALIGCFFLILALLLP
jgi:hypothetical protein